MIILCLYKFLKSFREVALIPWQISVQILAQNNKNAYNKHLRALPAIKHEQNMY